MQYGRENAAFCSGVEAGDGPQAARRAFAADGSTLL